MKPLDDKEKSTPGEAATQAIPEDSVRPADADEGQKMWSGTALAGAGSLLAVFAFVGGAAVGYTWQPAESGQTPGFERPGGGQQGQPPGQSQNGQIDGQAQGA
jgi:hypothetical protein